MALGAWSVTLQALGAGLRDRGTEAGQLHPSPIGHPIRRLLGASGSIEFAHADWSRLCGLVTRCHCVEPTTDLCSIRPDYREGLFNEALEKVSVAILRENAEPWFEVAESLQSCRLSKCQPLMHQWVEREAGAGYLLDVKGASRWMARGA